MKLGKINLFFIILLFSIFSIVNAEDRIISAPIINLENLEPSYETQENNEKDPASERSTKIKERNTINKKQKKY